MRVLLSIKPEFAEKIFDGEKLYEFRRSIFKSPNVEKIVIYASSPVKKIIGEFYVEDILSLDIDDLWDKTQHCSGIEKEFYYNYFEGKEIGHAIKVKQAVRYPEYQELSDYNIKYPPQSFMYLDS